jgi:hypothetical protein
VRTSRLKWYGVAAGGPYELHLLGKAHLFVVHCRSRILIEPTHVRY